MTVFGLGYFYHIITILGVCFIICNYADSNFSSQNTNSEGVKEG